MTIRHAWKNKAENLIVRDDETLGGIPVFAGTRVPVQTLLEYLERGFPLEEFLDDFPTVSSEQAISVLQIAKKALLEFSNESAIG